MNRIFLLFLGMISLSGFLGCSGNPYTIPVQYVEGTITVDSEPMQGVNVTFIPKGIEKGEGELATGVTDSHGKYRLTSANGPAQKGALVSEYHVTMRKIESTRQGSGEIPLDESGKVDPSQMSRGAGMVRMVVKQLLPIEYKDINTTPFSATVQKGKNKFDFDLKTNP